ncbi:MAG: alpha-glucuronidase family glycosyl hydrolase, partial [Planctomycetota bacterium]
MITINNQYPHENRMHRFVSTCAPNLWIAWVLIWFTATPLHASMVALSADTTLAQVDFAVTDLRAALTTAGHTVTVIGPDAALSAEIPTRIVMATQEQTAIIDNMRQQGASPSASLRAEGFSLRRTTSQKRVTYWVIGADAAGVKYGGLELAEVIRIAGLEAVKNVDQNPYMAMRGIK